VLMAPASHSNLGRYKKRSVFVNRSILFIAS
jgi:hypothetical protein